MSLPPCAIYPPELRLSHWERKKTALSDRHEVGDLLKALQKKHEAIDWRLFDASWARDADSSARLLKEFERRDRVYRGAVLALGREAGLLKVAARALEKGADRPTQEAARAIGAACDRLVKAIDTGMAELNLQHEQARAPLERRETDAERKARAEAADGPEDDDDAAPLDALLSPQRLLQQLKLCRRDPERRVNFAYIDGRGGDEPVVFVLHPRIAARRLFARLQTETGRRVGTHGTSWLEDTRLMIQPHKPISGMARKVRAPVRAAGFRITRAVLCQPDGGVIEQDLEEDLEQDVEMDGDGDLNGPVHAVPGAFDPTGVAGPSDATPAADDPAALAAQWHGAAERIAPRIAAALASGRDDGKRIGAVWAYAQDKAAAGQHAAALEVLRSLVPMLQPAAGARTGAVLLAELKARFQALTDAFVVLPESAPEGIALMKALPAQVQAGDLDAARRAMTRLDEFLMHKARLDEERLGRVHALRATGAASLPVFPPPTPGSSMAVDQVQQAMDDDPDLATSAGLIELVQASRRADELVRFAIGDASSSAARGALASIQGLTPLFEAYLTKHRFDMRRLTKRNKHEQARQLQAHHRQQLDHLDALATTLERLETFDVPALARAPDEATRALGWLDALLLNDLPPGVKALARARRWALLNTLMAAATTREALRQVADLGGRTTRASFDRQEALGPLADTARRSQARARHARTGIHHVANAENIDQSRLLSMRLVADDGSLELAALYLSDPEDLAGASPASRQMARALNLLRESATALGRLESIQAPASHSHAARLIRATLGLAPNAVVTDAHARRAALASLLCELRQEQVGSCFATQEVIRMHDTDPAAYLKDVTQMINEGRITRRLPDGKMVTANTQITLPPTTVDAYVIRMSRGTAPKLIGSTLKGPLATPVGLHDAPGFQAAMAAIGIAAEHGAAVMDRALTDLQATQGFRRHQNQRALATAVQHITDPDMRDRVHTTVWGAIHQPPHRVGRLLTATLLNVDPSRRPPRAVPAAEREAAQNAFKAVLDAPAFSVEPVLVIEALVGLRLGLTEADVQLTRDCETLRREIVTHPDMIAGTPLMRPRDDALLDQCDRLEAMDRAQNRKMIQWEALRQEAIARFLAEDQCPVLRACEFTLASLLEHGRSTVGPMQQLQQAQSQQLAGELARLARQVVREPEFANARIGATVAGHIAQQLMSSYDRLFAEGTSTGYDASMPSGVSADGHSGLGAWCLYDIQGIKDPDRWIRIQDAQAYSRLVKGIMLLAWKVNFDNAHDAVITRLSRAIADAQCARLTSEDFMARLSRTSTDLTRSTLNTPWHVATSGRYAESAIEVLGERTPKQVVLSPSADARQMVGKIGSHLKTLWNDPATGVRAGAERHGDAATVLVSNLNVHVFSLVPGDADLHRMLSDSRDFEIVLDEHVDNETRKWRKASRRVELRGLADVREQLRLLRGDDITEALAQQVWSAIERQPTMQAFYDEMRRVCQQEGQSEASIDQTFGKHALEFLVPPIPAADLEPKLRPAATILQVPSDRIDAVVHATRRALLAVDPVRSTAIDIRDQLEIAMRAQGLDTEHVLQQRIAPALRGSTGLIFADSNWGDAEHRVKFALVVNPITGKPEAWHMNEDGSQPEPLDEDKYVHNEWIVAT